MIADIHLPAPILRMPIFSEKYAIPIGSCLASWSSAQDGEPVAIRLDLTSYEPNDFSAIAVLMKAKSEEAEASFLEDLDAATLARISPWLLLHLRDAEARRRVSAVISDMCSNDAINRSLSLFISAEAALLVSTEEDLYHDHVHAEGTIHADDLAGYLALIIPGRLSRHAEINLGSKLQPLLDHVNRNVLKEILPHKGSLALSPEALFKSRVIPAA